MRLQPIRHVLCATDLSSTSRHAFDAALTLAKASGAILVMLHVPGRPVFPMDARLDAPTLGRLRARVRARALERLRTLSARARRRGVTSAILLCDGDPGDQIVRIARASNVDLIVIGTHARRGLPKVYCGSVAQQVMSSAPCPVVTVRGR